MLMRRLRSARRRLAREQGTTLIELLVVVLAGTIVGSALFTVLDVTLHSTTRTFSRVDATQRSRTAMENVVNELHSSCIADSVTPIQPNSTGTSLIFISQFGNAANVTPVEREIDLNDTTGVLTETDFPVSGGTAPNWTFSTTASSSTRLLTNVHMQGPVNNRTPAFQYFAYQEPMQSPGVPYTDAGGNPYMMLIDGTSQVPATTVVPPAQPLATPLSVADSQLASEVSIKLAVGPTPPPNANGLNGGINTNLSDVNDDVADSIVLRLTPAANHVGSGNSFLPCQ
jgi:hypothetical protein